MALKPKTLTDKSVTSPAPYRAVALRRVGGDWQVVTLTVQGSVVIREEPGVANMYDVAVSDFKVAAVRAHDANARGES